MPKVKKQRQSASKVVHPNSRKASQLRKKAHRTERVELHKLEHKKVVSHKGGQREGEIGCKAKLSRVD